MATGVEELLDMLFEMIDEAKSMPLSSDKCILERDKALDLLDEIRAQFPMELAEAKKLIAARTEYIASAKREGELIRKQAEDKAKQIVSEDELLAQAKQKANELMRTAEERSRDLRKAANDYCEDALRRTEEAVAEAYDEIKKSRARFRALAGGAAQTGRQPYDVATDGIEHIVGKDRSREHPHRQITVRSCKEYISAKRSVVPPAIALRSGIAYSHGHSLIPSQFRCRDIDRRHRASRLQNLDLGPPSGFVSRNLVHTLVVQHNGHTLLQRHSYTVTPPRTRHRRLYARAIERYAVSRLRRAFRGKGHLRGVAIPVHDIVHNYRLQDTVSRSIDHGRPAVR